MVEDYGGTGMTRSEFYDLLARRQKKPHESQQRKQTPIYSGPMTYFPLALAAVARLCLKSNQKHNPGEELHWARHKSPDHKNCIARHLLDSGTMDPEFDELHDVALAWRALANLQLAEEKRLGIIKESK